MSKLGAKRLSVRVSCFVAAALACVAAAIAANPVGASAGDAGIAHILTGSIASTMDLVDPDLGPTTPFGSVAYDPLPASPDPPVYPIWTPAPCEQDAGYATLMYADDPETWTPGAWDDVHNVLLEEMNVAPGSSGPADGLVQVYFDNALGTTARLYIGALGQSAPQSLQAAWGTSASFAPVTLVGARASAAFLNFYAGTSAWKHDDVPGPQTLPAPLVTITVKNNQVVSGELAVRDVSGPTTLYVYADDCSPTACPGIGNIAPDDSKHRRGNFPAAHFTIAHDITGSIDNSSGGISWLDIGRPKAQNDTCVSPITGSDPLDGNAIRVLAGDYGVPIEIDGGTLGPPEYFYYHDRGNLPWATALYVSGFEDPMTLNDVAPGAYEMPTTEPGVSPQPSTAPSPDDAVVVGANAYPDARKIVYIPPGGNSWPSRFYYIVPAGFASHHAPTSAEKSSGRRAR